MRQPAASRRRLGRASLGAVLLLVVASTSGSGPAERLESRAAAAAGSGCTVVYAADDSGAYGGNNEDERSPLTRIWFIPGQAPAYGSVFVGYDDLVMQGAMNEAGLFFDALGVREVEVPERPGKPPYAGQDFVADVLSGCDSVACVLDRFDSVSMPGTWNGQYLFGDRFGDSAIIEPLTVIPKRGPFQVATNFFQSEVPPAERTDERYRTATRMLERADGFSLDLVRDVLDATRQSGTVNTVYSTIYDLESRVVHLSYFGDVANEVTFDLRAELTKGVHGYEIAELFPPNAAAEAVAAPIRAQIAAKLAEHGATAVMPESLGALTGTFEIAPGVELDIAEDRGALLAREPLTPWVELVAISDTEFVRTFADGAGTVHEQLLRFAVDGGSASRIEIVIDDAATLVAVRTGTPAAAVPWQIIVAGVMAAVLLGIATAILVRRRRTSGGLRAARTRV